MTRHRRPILSAAVPAALVLLLLPGCETRPAVAETPIRFSDIDSLALEGLTERFLDLAWSLRPALASPARCPRAWGGRIVAGREQIMAATQRTRNLLARARGVGTVGLTRSQRQDRRLLIDLLESYRVELEEVRTWNRDPGVYLDGIEASLGHARRGDNPTVQAERTRVRLQALPDLLGRARSGLGRCPRPFVEVAAQRARDLAADLEGGRRLPRPHQAGLAEELGRAATTAAGALRRYADALEGTPAEAFTGALAMPARAFRTILRLREGMTAAPSRLLAELSPREERLAARVTGGREGAGSADLRQTAIEASRRLTRERRLLPADLWTGAAPKSHPETTPAAITLAAATRGYPGLRALDEILDARPDLSLLRRGHPCRTFRLGWATYAGEVLAAAHPALAGALARQRWLATLEARLALGLQVGSLTLRRVESELATKLGLDRTAARRRAVDLARDPWQVLGYRVCDVLLDRRERMRDRTGRALRLADYHRLVLEPGPVPLALLVEHLAAEESQQ